MITTIEPVHIENFESVEGIADAKAEIFEGNGSGDGVGRAEPRSTRFYRPPGDHGQSTAGITAAFIGFGAHPEADICGFWNHCRLLEPDSTRRGCRPRPASLEVPAIGHCRASTG